MSLNHRQQRELQRIESRLLQSEPRLAAMLAVFARLSVGQRMPGWEQEQAATRLDRMRQAAVLIAKAITVIAAAMGLLVSAILAFVTALVMGSRAQPPQPTRQ